MGILGDRKTHSTSTPRPKSETSIHNTRKAAEYFKLHEGTHTLGTAPLPYLRNEAILQIPPALGPPRATLGGHSSLPRHSCRRSPVFSIQEPALAKPQAAAHGRPWGNAGCSAGSRAGGGGGGREGCRRREQHSAPEAHPALQQADQPPTGAEPSRTRQSSARRQV